METKRLNHTPIYYYVSGNMSGECILFIHAAFADHTMFDKQVSYFQKSYKVITLDLIGHGQSVDTKKGDSIDKMADYIFQIMRAENISKIHFVGVSLGSVIIQDFANKYPDHVASLSCFGGYDVNNFDPAMQKGNGKEQMLMMLKAVFSIKWFAESNKKISAVTHEAQEAFYQMNIRFRKRSFMYLATLSSMVNKFETKVRNYNLLIGCGEKDIPMELEAVSMWSTCEPKSKKVIFSNAGHLVNMDAPEEFNKTMEQFIKGDVSNRA